MWTLFSVQISPITWRRLHCFKGSMFRPLVLPVKDQYGTLLEWYWRVKTEEIGEKSVGVAICPPQIPCRFVMDLNRASAKRGWRLTNHLFVVYLFLRTSLQWAMASSFTRFLGQTQQRATVGRISLDEWSAPRRNLYLTTHNTHDRHTCTRWDSNPQSQKASGRKPTPLTLRPLG